MIADDPHEIVVDPTRFFYGDVAFKKEKDSKDEKQSQGDHQCTP